MKRTLLIAAAAALVACVPAVAAPQQDPGPGMSMDAAPRGHGGRLMKMGGHSGAGFGLLQFDANADGKLTRAEFDAAQNTRFAEFDGNKDGSATPEEIKAAAEVRREKMEKARFAALDTDKNGQLSQTELAAARDGRPGRAGPDGPGRGRGRLAKGERVGPLDANSYQGPLTLTSSPPARPAEGRSPARRPKADPGSGSGTAPKGRWRGLCRAGAGGTLQNFFPGPLRSFNSYGI